MKVLSLHVRELELLYFGIVEELAERLKIAAFLSYGGANIGPFSLQNSGPRPLITSDSRLCQLESAILLHRLRKYMSNMVCPTSNLSLQAIMESS